LNSSIYLENDSNSDSDEIQFPAKKSKSDFKDKTKIISYDYKEKEISYNFAEKMISLKKIPHPSIRMR
jgi:hypothetical protein